MINIRLNSKDNEVETLNIIVQGVQKEVQNGYYILGGVVKTVFEAISSCFGLGYWRNEKGWLNQEGWRNNKK